MESVMELLVVLLGMVTSVVMVGFKRAVLLVDKMPSIYKAMLVMALSVPVAWLAGKSGLALPADPTTWDGNVVNSILTWLLAMGAHAGAKAIQK